MEVAAVRRDFPLLSRTVASGKPVVYLDSAATSQKPRSVIEAVNDFNTWRNANVHRGVHFLSEQATVAYDAVRERVRAFLNAARAEEIVFAHGTTAAINLVAQSFGRSVLRAGDEILLTEMEHHSNIVPWQLLREQTGAVIRVAPVTDRGELTLEAFESMLGPRTRIVALAHVSNVLGTVNPVREIVELAHRYGAAVLVDGAQAAPHLPVNLQELGCDFFVCSGHKMLGPTGVGVLYGRLELLERMPPYQGGGGMIASVTFERTVYAPVPAKFEAGTPPIAEVMGLGAAAEYIEGLGWQAIAAHEHDLLTYATDRLAEIPGLRIVGTAREKTAVLSFVMAEAHPHDIGTVLDSEGIAIRAGHHCAQPLLSRFGLPATARASFGVYNTREEVDRLFEGLLKVRKVFA
ncbi:MAG: aminotransferase class V-fold PLP-dependent enzyme [Gemmatimonadales bacterium]